MAGLMNLEQVRAPQEDSIYVLAITTSASAEQDTGLTEGTREFTFTGDVAFFITFGNDGATGTITAPDGTAVTTGARTWRVGADQMVTFVVGPRNRYFKVRGTDAGFVRWTEI